jgi:hypothetical protein
MPRLVGEASIQECVDYLAGKLHADDTTAEYQHVDVVVLNALVRRIRVMTQPGAAIDAPRTPRSARFSRKGHPTTSA